MLTVKQIRDRYSNESPDWIRERIADLRVSEAKADSQSAAIIRDMLDELIDHIAPQNTAQPVEPTTPESVVEVAPEVPLEAPEAPDTPPPGDGGTLTLADMTNADIKQLNRHPLQKLAKANNIPAGGTNDQIRTRLIRTKKALNV